MSQNEKEEVYIKILPDDLFLLLLWIDNNEEILYLLAGLSYGIFIHYK